MYLGQFNNTDKTKVLEIRNDVQKLFITTEWTGPKVADQPANLRKRAQVMAYYSGLAMNGKISVTRYLQSGTKQLIQGMQMYDLAEIAANNEGVVEITSKNPDDVNNTTYITRVSIELCNEGSIRCTDKDFIRVEFDGFSKYTLAGADYDATHKVYTFGSFKVVNEHLKYSPIACQANAVVQFTCEGAYAIAVPDTCTKLTLDNITGVTQEFRSEELPHISNDMEDNVYQYDGIVISFQRWRIIPLQFASRGTVQLTETAQVYLLTNKDYNSEITTK